MNILFEDNEILVCEKPPGIPSQSGRMLGKDMVNQLKNYLSETGNSNTPPYLGLIHRLDQPVGGVMVFAKTPEAAKNLSSQITNRMMKKKYLAVVTNDLTNELSSNKIELEDYLVKNGVTNLSRIASQKEKNAKKAVLTYQVLEVIHEQDSKDNTTKTPLSLIEIDLETGRHHQIRVQLSAHKNGLWGDTKYNSLFKEQTDWVSIALFAYELSFKHPKTKKTLNFKIYPESKPFNHFQYLKNKQEAQANKPTYNH